jgi:hypothetical protein
LDLRDENQKLFLHKTGFKVLLQWKLFHSGAVYATATLSIQDEVLTVVNTHTYRIFNILNPEDWDSIFLWNTATQQPENVTP